MATPHCCPALCWRCSSSHCISSGCRGDLEGIDSKVEEDQSTATSRTEELKTWECAPKNTCSCHPSMPARHSLHAWLQDLLQHAMQTLERA